MLNKFLAIAIAISAPFALAETPGSSGVQGVVEQKTQPNSDLEDRALNGDKDAQLELLKASLTSNDPGEFAQSMSALMLLGMQGHHGAIELLQKKAEEGSPNFKVGYAMAMAYPAQGKPNKDIAVKHMAEAAYQGLPDALMGMGMFYINGILATKNYLRAENYFRLAAEQGSTEAMRSLGQILQISGNGSRNEEAFDWLKKAAVRGDMQAQHLVGEAYMQGKGVPQDRVKAKTWFSTAAHNGNPKAQYSLAKFLHQEGQNGEAYAWLTLVDGVVADDGVKQLREKISRRLTEEDKKKSELVLLRYARNNKK